MNERARPCALVGARALGSKARSASREAKTDGAHGRVSSSVNTGTRRLFAADTGLERSFGTRSAVVNAKSAEQIALRPRALSAFELPRRPVVKPRYDGRSARRAAKIDWMLVTELQSRGSFGVCTKLADLVTWHSSAAHGGGSCTMRSTKAASYTSIVTVRGSSETVGALHCRM